MVLNPLSEKEIIERGYIYRKPQIGIGNNFSDDLPDSSYEINQSIYDKIFKCNYSGLPYKIIKQEVDFLKLFKLPLPRQAPMYRMINRYEVISKTDLCNGECSICKKNLESYYDFSSRKILCHDCFIKQIY